MPRASRLAACFSIVVLVVVVLKLITASQLQLGDALFLAKNSIKEYHFSAICRSRYFAGCTSDSEREVKGEGEPGQVIGLDLDLDSPFTNVVNSVFPIDLIISYNFSNETHEMLARYASFSPIISRSLTSEYAIVPGKACEGPWEPENKEEFEDKILIVLRGKCTFVKKIRNLLESDLRPRAIIVANDEPYRALITMYLASFNADGKLTTPVLFILNEDYKELGVMSLEHLKILIRTAAFDNWINLLLSMAVSPPLLILICYLLVRTLQMCRKRRVSALNQRLVKNLPVYIYHRNHLIPAHNFYVYLTATYQTGDIPLVPSSSEDISSITEPDNPASMKSFVINGTDLYSLRKLLGILFAPDDFFPTFKCSICLDKFTPLQLRVLVLDCHHIFHEKCLSNWLINFRRTCPLCNDIIKPTETLPLLNSMLEPMMTQQAFDLGALERDVGFNGAQCSRATQDYARQLPEVLSTAAVRSFQLESAASDPGHSNEHTDQHSSSNSSFVTSFSQPETPVRGSAASSLPSAYFTPNLSAESRYEDTQNTQDTMIFDGYGRDRQELQLSHSRTPTVFTAASSSSAASTIRME